MYNAIPTWDDPFLDLSNRNIDDEILIKICNALSGNTKVKYLLLDHNQITNKGVILLTKSLQYVENLSLSYNNIDDTCLLILAKSKFKSLDLSWNNITNKGVDILIKHCKQRNISVDSLFVSEKKRQELSNKLFVIH